MLALLVHGYHPYSEDAGIYVAGIKLRLDPQLYPASAAFIRPYLRLSLFSNWNAWLVRGLHLPLDVVLFATQVGTTWLLLYSCLRLARRCFARAGSTAHWGAVGLITLCLTVPVAGSSLFLMDPYVTSRSISTPLTLLAVCACLERRLGQAVAWLTVIGLFHPLMAIYAGGFVLLLEAIRRRSWIGWSGLSAGALLLGAAVQYSQRNVVETAAHHAAVLTRYYYFLSVWHGYEWVGLIAPLVLLALYCGWRQHEAQGHEADVSLAYASIAIGAIAIALCLLFARPDSASHLMATLQPIRSFLFVYYCMFLLLGGLLGQYWLKRVAWRWALLVGALGGLMYGVARATYPALAQVELPWVESRNPWAEAFLWVRMNTPVDAVVAVDANYFQADEEDAQGLRAMTERSSLADFSKDGGSASIFPALADKWMIEHNAVTGLNRMSDAERRQRLAPFHVHWLILEQRVATALECPYANERVKVCQLR